MNIAILKRVFPVILVIVLAVGDYVSAQPDPDDYIDWGIHAWDYSRVGKAGWQFLKLPTNARYAAMGGIISALGRGDASAANGNPAMLADVKNIEASVSGMNWIADVKYMSGAVAKRLGRAGVLGLNVISVDYGDMERTENQEQFDDAGETLGRTLPIFNLGTFTGGDFSIGLSYARQMTDRLQVGVNVRYVQETLDDATTGNVAVDVGTMYYTGLGSFRISMVGRNFGPDAEFVEYEERIGTPAMKVRMPMVFVLGAAVDVIEKKEGSPHLWTVAAEFTHPNDGPEKVHLGTEYSLFDFVFLRGGYKFNYDEEGLTLGAGLRVHFSNFSFLVNYAYIDFGRLNKVHMFSSGFSF